MEQPQDVTSAACGQSRSTVELGARPINCDQVAWILNAIERYLPPTQHPRVSRAREMQKYALLYELMEVAHLYFEDGAAQHNGTPHDVRRFQYASKAAEAATQANLAGNLMPGPYEKAAYREGP